MSRRTEQTALLRLQGEANTRFDVIFNACVSRIPKAEREQGAAWTTDYAHDKEIDLQKEEIMGSAARIILQSASDFTPEMITSLSPPVEGRYFDRRIKGPDDAYFQKTTDWSQAQIGQRFVELLGRAEVALMQ